MESKHLHEIKLGWYVWLETNINEFGIMLKSILWISLVGTFITYAASIVTISLGIVSTKLSFHFLGDFAKLSFESLQDSNYHSLWYKAGSILMDDMGKLFLYHAPFGIIASYYFFKHVQKKSKEMEKTRFIKGTKLIPEEERLRDIAKKVSTEGLQTHLELGRIPMPYRSEVEHTAIVAVTRAGKGVMATKIIPKIALDPKAKAIIHDKKPEWTKLCLRPERGDLIFNPFDARSIKWTIGNDIRDVVDIKAAAYAIVPHEPESKDHFWQNSARDILESIFLYLWERENLTNAAIREIIYLPGDELADAIRGYKGAELARKTDCLATLKTQMAWVDFLEDGDFSIRDWVDNANGLLFLLNPRRTEALLKPVLTLLVDIACASILELPDDESRRIHLFLDEFTTLNKITSLIDISKLGASKGAPLWLMFQDVKQINKIYGDHDADTLLGNCKNIAVGQIKDPKAAEYLSQRFGKQEFYEHVKTNSMGANDNKDGQSLNDQRKEDFVVKPTDLINLPKRQFFVMIEGYEGVTQTTADIQNLPIIAEDFVPVVLSKEEQLKLLRTQTVFTKNNNIVSSGENIAEKTDDELLDDIENVRDFFS